MTHGETVTLTTTVTPAPPLPASVTFSGPVGFSGSADLNAVGVAMLETAALPVGTHEIEASFAATATHTASSDTASVSVLAIVTQVALSSSNNPANHGETVTFTAQVTPATAGGSVVFSIDGADQTPSPLNGGTASFSTSLLSVGEHEVVAQYQGDATHAASASDPLTQTVLALGSVIVRQVAGGSQDASFGFSSPTPALNLSVTTSGGVGESMSVQLPAGSYAVTGADMSSAGFALVSVACSDNDSTGDVESRTASIALEAGETVTCTFTAVNAREDTLDTIASFMQARAGILLSNQPDPQRRFDRLNGTGGGSGGNPVASLMAYLPGMVEGSTLSMSGSLAQVERLAGNEQPSRLDAWFSLTHGRYTAGGADGDFTLAAAGADWLFSRNLLVGGFVQFDLLSQDHDITGAAIEGTGWLAGPYLTARLSEHLFLDILAAGGRSDNTVSPYGTYEDDFAATRFLASAILQGHWTSGGWTFSPRARLSWFRERSDAYVDSLGVLIPQVTVETGQFAFGPGVSYRFDTEEGIAVDAGLRFDAVAEFAKNSVTGDEDSVHGRVEGSIGFAFPGGARLSLTASHDGIGQSGTSATAGKISVNVPLN